MYLLIESPKMGLYQLWVCLTYLGTTSLLNPLKITYTLFQFLGWSHYTLGGSTPFQGVWEHENTTLLSSLKTVLLGMSPNSISAISPCACLSCLVYGLLKRGPFIFLLINSLLNNSWRYRPLIFCNLHHHTLTYVESWAFWSFCFRSILIFLWPLVEGSWDISF